MALSWYFLCSSGRSPVLVDQAVDDLPARDPAGHVDRLAGFMLRWSLFARLVRAMFVVMPRVPGQDPPGGAARHGSAGGPGTRAIAFPRTPGRRTSSRISSGTGGRPVVSGWVHLFLTMRRCQASSVAGAAIRCSRGRLGSSRASAVITARSAPAQVRCSARVLARHRSLGQWQA